LKIKLRNKNISQSRKYWIFCVNFVVVIGSSTIKKLFIEILSQLTYLFITEFIK